MRFLTAIIFGIALCVASGCKEDQLQDLASALGVEVPQSVEHLRYDRTQDTIRILCGIAPADLEAILYWGKFDRAEELDQTIDFGITDEHVFRGVKIYPITDAIAFLRTDNLSECKLWISQNRDRVYLIYKTSEPIK